MNNNKLKMLVYGDPGIGKTVFCGSVVDVPELMPALMLDLEGNTDSIESKCNYLNEVSELGNPQPGKIDVLRVQGTPKISKGKIVEDTSEIFIRLEDACKYLAEEFSDSVPYKTVIIDSLSDVDKYVTKYVLDTFSIKRFNPRLPELKDYQMVNTVMMDIINVLKLLDYHLIVTCKPYFEGEDQSEIRPKLTGQLRTEIPGALKYSCPLVSRNGKRVLYFQPFGKYSAKDCSENSPFGEKLEEPTLSKVYNLRYK